MNTLNDRISIKTSIMTLILILVSFIVKSQTDTMNIYSLNYMAKRALNGSYEVRNKNLEVKKSLLDKRTAYMAYLPKISGQLSYTHLNEDVRLPSELEDLLMGTQRLLIKEATAMKMSGMNVPDAYKVNFTTPYTANPNNPYDPSNVLAKALQDNLKEVTPIQEKNILKANVSMQCLLFDGGKVMYSANAAQHQANMNQHLSEKEKSAVLLDLVTTYDKLAVLVNSELVLAKTAIYLKQQEKYVNEAKANGLATNLEVQKIKLAKQQLEAKQIELNSNKELVFNRLEQITKIPYKTLDVPFNVKFEKWILPSTFSQIENRSDLKALDEAIQATDYKRKAELTEYVPKVVAFGKKEFLTDDLSTFDPQWYVGIALNWTIFDGLTANNNAQQAKLNQLILENKKQNAQELLTINLERASIELSKCEQLVEVAQQQVITSEETFRISEKQYQNGLIPISEYLLSVKDLENARLDLIKAIAAQRFAAVSKLDATGSLTIENLQ